MSKFPTDPFNDNRLSLVQNGADVIPFARPPKPSCSGSRSRSARPYNLDHSQRFRSSLDRMARHCKPSGTLKSTCTWFGPNDGDAA